MQLNASEYEDLPFDVDEMNNLASSINNFEKCVVPVLSRKQNGINTAKETEFLNLGPAPRTKVKHPIANPIVDRIKNSNKNINNNNFKNPSKPFIERPQVIDYQPLPSKTGPVLTYDDLLSNMNIVIRNGVMYRANNIQPIAPAKQIPQKVHLPIPIPPARLRQQQPKNMKVPKGGNYILNKYFKDQVQAEEKASVQIPRTKEEFKKMLIFKKIKQFLARKRIEKIKPKKMLFNNQNTNILQGLGLDPNNLFKLNR
uniref:Uncharacterized protein n=1 Tax=viral metagenome TaxID=1070528 RepID=A0A6C0F5N4_9ZZZZ